MISIIKRIFYTLCILAVSQISFGQHYYTSQEYGVVAGISNYFGDLNPNYGFQNVKPVIGVLFKQHINPYISVVAMLNGTQVGYEDALSTNEFQKIRNLDFKSYILELGVAGEFNFLWFETGKHDRRFTPYLTLGLAGFYSNPYTYLNDKKYNLKSIGTEGQNTAEYKNRKYSNFNIAVPLGVGFKTWIKPGLNFTFEIANRFTTTDYIDDVSQTYVGGDYFGGEQSNSSAYKLQDKSPNHQLGKKNQQRGDKISFDQYFFVQAKLTFQLKSYKCPSHLKGVWEP
jgi:hypothetical protein